MIMMMGMFEIPMMFINFHLPRDHLHHMITFLSQSYLKF